MITRLASAGRTHNPRGWLMRKDTEMSEVPAVVTAAPQQREISMTSPQPEPAAQDTPLTCD